MRIIILLELVCVSLATSQDIRFFKEDITFRITRESFMVEGFYWFLNPTSIDVEQLIFYPFGSTHKNETIDSVETYNITKGSAQEIGNLSNAGFSFLLHISRYDTAIVRIKYKQKIICDSVTYILRSTQRWKRPLQLAEYKLRIDNETTITNFSLKPDKTYLIGDEKIYYWRRIDFMPELDLMIHFKPI